MAEDARTKKLEKAVKKLKAELDSQKADFQEQLQDKTALVDSLKAKVEAAGAEEKGGDDDKAGGALQEVIDTLKEANEEKEDIKVVKVSEGINALVEDSTKKIITLDPSYVPTD